MAPKADKGKGKRPRGEGSATEDDNHLSAQDTFRFVDYQAEQQYLKTIRHRPLLVEAPFDFSGVEARAERVLHDIETRGWRFFLETPAPINASLVREFYANWRRTSQSEVYLRGRQIPVSPHALRDALQLNVTPYDRQPDDYQQLLQQLAEMDKDVIKDRITYPGTEWIRNAQFLPTHLKSSLLNFEARLWMKLVFSQVLPCSHVTNLTLDQVCLIYCLVEGKRVYLPRLIWRQMGRVHHDKACNGLPYPSLVTRMAVSAATPTLPDDVLVEPGKPVVVKNLLPKDSKAKKKSQRRESGASSSNPMQAVLDRIDSLQIELQAHITESIQAAEGRIMRQVLRLHGIDPPAEPEHPPPPPARRSAPRDDPDSDSREDDPDAEISEEENSEDEDC